MFTYDPGFTSTGSCASKITYIDGDEGVLLYRGYNIAELAEQSDFMECCYLLMNGELPSKAQKDKFVKDITQPHDGARAAQQFYRGFRRDAHPMAVCCGVVGALSAFYHDSLDIHDPHQRMVASYRLIAKMPTIAAMAYKYSVGQPFVYPRNDLVLRRQLPAHDVLGSGRGIRGQPGHREGDGPHPDAARRPRAERLDLDRAPRRLLGRQPVRLHRRRHRLAVGPEPRRRQRGRASTCCTRSAASRTSRAS